MLVLTRKASQEIVIDDEIRVRVLAVHGSRVRLGILAPDGVTVLREELIRRDDRWLAPTATPGNSANAETPVST